MWGPLVSGALTMGYAVVCLFFLRYWRDTRDRLFAWFAMAFALLAVQRLLLVFVPQEQAVVLYGVRALAFTLIIVAIAEKNRSAS
jgi:membrane-associated PAP2 superfamily phosphatase